MIKKKSWKEETGLKEEMRIKKLMLETKDHDHEKCDCEGCFWWCMTRTISQNGRLFYVIPSWDDLDRDEYIRTLQRTIHYRMDKSLPKEKLIEYLIKQGVPKEHTDKIAEEMLTPIFTVMFGKAPSPLGLLRDI